MFRGPGGSCIFSADAVAGPLSGPVESLLRRRARQGRRTGKGRRQGWWERRASTRTSRTHASFAGWQARLHGNLERAENDQPGRPLLAAVGAETAGAARRQQLCRRLCATSAKGRGGPNVCNCLIDEGRPLGTGLQEQVPNHLRRLWSKAMVVSTEGKGLERTRSGDWQEEDRKGTTDDMSKA